MRGGAVVARQAHNLKVSGSIPLPATKKFHRVQKIVSDFFIVIKICYNFLFAIIASDAVIMSIALRYSTYWSCVTHAPRLTRGPLPATK